MIDPQKQIRKAVIDALTGRVNRPIRIDGYRPLIWNDVDSTWAEASDQYADQVEVYNEVPVDAVHPFIKVTSRGYNEVDFNRNAINIESFVSIEVVTAFQGGVGGELEINDVVSGILQIIRKRDPQYFDLSEQGLNIYRMVIEDVTYITGKDRDSTFFKAIIDLAVTTEQS